MIFDLSFFFGPQRCCGCGETFPFSEIHTRPLDDKTFELHCGDCA